MAAPILLSTRRKGPVIYIVTYLMLTLFGCAKNSFVGGVIGFSLSEVHLLLCRVHILGHWNCRIRAAWATRHDFPDIISSMFHEIK